MMSSNEPETTDDISSGLRPPTLPAAAGPFPLAAGCCAALARLPVSFLLPVLLVLLAFRGTFLHQGLLLPYSFPGGLNTGQD